MLNQEGFKFGINSRRCLETIPKYKKDNPGFRISLLHLDLDTYQGTKIVLENFYDLVTPGGIILG